MVTFADLLGTSEHAKSANAQVTLAALDAALALARRESDVDDMADYFFTSWFSDNVAMTAPIGSDEIEMQIGLMLLSTAWLQFHLAQGGFFLRGGMQFGLQYADPSITFGPALVDAVRLEHATKYPRVALSPLATSIVGIVAVDHFDIANNPFHYELAVDQDDGTTFVSYLDSVIGELDHPADADGVLAEHRAVLTSQLDAQAHGDPAVLAKIDWLADYHNFVCRCRGSEELTIPSAPGRAFDRYAPPASKADALEAATALLETL